MALASSMVDKAGYGLCIGALALALGFGRPAAAQTVTAVSMVLQDFSDCTNSNVKDNGGAAPGGTAWIVKNGDGSVGIKVAISATPLTTYNFFLKCVRQLGTIATDEDGAGAGIFIIPSGGVGQVFAFDMYPNGAPAGNKFQSVQIHLP